MKKLMLLLAGHALFDYPLQGDFLARGKNQASPLVGVPWYQCAIAHALLHSASVGVITRSTILSIAEFGVHFATDYAKCAGRLTFNQDQAIHYTSKVFWAVLSQLTAPATAPAPEENQ